MNRSIMEGDPPCLGMIIGACNEVRQGYVYIPMNIPGGQASSASHHPSPGIWPAR
jgi:hypothetical protein